MTDILKQFLAVPGRVFLDSSVLQAVHSYGEQIFENQELPADARIARTPEGNESIEALTAIFAVNKRAQFQFALSEASLGEAADRQDPGYLQWAFDVMDHCRVWLAESGGPEAANAVLSLRMDHPRFGYLSVKDRRLLADAMALGCDAFLTMDFRLLRNGDDVGRAVGLRLLSPAAFWDVLKPWAGLWG